MRTSTQLKGHFPRLISPGAWTQGHHPRGLGYLITARLPRASNPYAIENLVQFFSRGDNGAVDIRRVLLANDADLSDLDVLQMFEEPLRRG